MCVFLRIFCFSFLFFALSLSLSFSSAAIAHNSPLSLFFYLFLHSHATVTIVFWYCEIHSHSVICFFLFFQICVRFTYFCVQTFGCETYAGRRIEAMTTKCDSIRAHSIVNKRLRKTKTKTTKYTWKVRRVRGKRRDGANEKPINNGSNSSSTTITTSKIPTYSYT